MIKKRQYILVVPGVWAAVAALIACGSTLALALPDSESSLVGVGESLGQDHPAERTSYQTTTAATDLDTLLYQDWEGGTGNWWVDNGVWQVGVATVGPDSAHSGQECAATVLDGNYPGYASTRLISPPVSLPSLDSGEPVSLRFWHWFRLYESAHGTDQGRIQISVNGGVWRTISGPYSGWSPVWSQTIVDLSAYSDSTVSIAFHFTSDWVYEDNGWYVDDIAVVEGPIALNDPEGFELGIGGWSADNGLWEAGVPTAGPGTAHAGQNCVATVLGGNYPGHANTRLVSPQISLPGLAKGEAFTLKFWHWFHLYESAHGPDQGHIQISVDGGVWRTIYGPFSGWSPVWSQVCVDLSAYADSTVSIAYYFTSDWTYEDSGWYVDDVAIVEGPVVFNNPEGFELGPGDWSADNGLWEVGVPTAGPDTAHSGVNCVATVLGGNYPAYANTRLISPEILLTPAPGQVPMLYYWHWFRLYQSAHGSDEGRIQISVNGGEWETTSGPFSGTSPLWSQVGVNLSAYADSTVNIAFYFTSDWVYEDQGWYIDDVRIVGILPTGVDDPHPAHDAAGPLVLYQNAPNPFRPTTTISYQVDIPGQVSIDIYNSAGQHVENLVDRYYERGLYHVDWNSSGVSSGVYLYRVVCGDWCDTRKCVVLK